MDGIRVGVAQLGAVVGDVAANLRTAGRVLRQASEAGAELVVLPECFVQGYETGAHPARCAEPADGEAGRALRALAADRGVAVIAGFIEANPDDPGRPFNSALVIGRDGTLAGVYRKVHLFGDEAEVFATGERFPVFGVPVRSRPDPLRVGVCICMDVEFPEVPRLLALAGAELIAIPSANMEPFRAQQASELAARAIENNLHVALANTVDRRARVTFFGGSGIARPDGTVVSAGYGRRRLVVAELSDAAVEASGGRGSYLRQRRVDTYRELLHR